MLLGALVGLAQVGYVRGAEIRNSRAQLTSPATYIVCSAVGVRIALTGRGCRRLLRLCGITGARSLLS